MNGNREYELKIENKINNLLNLNPGLKGFHDYISNRSLTTIYDYMLHINNFIKYVNKEVGDINFDDFTSYLSKSKKKEDGNPTTPAYRILIYQALKKYGKYLAAKGIITSNPMDSIDRPNGNDLQSTKEKREKGYLDQEEICDYMSAVSCGCGSERSVNRQYNWRERDMAIITIFLTTGMRCSALMKLDVNNINFDTKSLSVTDKENKVNMSELSDDTLNVISEWMKKRKKILNGIEEDALFISNRKKRINSNSIAAIVTKYAQCIPNKHITPHKLRATYGTQLYDATHDIYFVQECMNHANPKTTELYIRGVNNQTKKASNIMSGIINK